MTFGRISSILSTTITRASVGAHRRRFITSVQPKQIVKGYRALSTAGIFPLSGVEAVLSGSAPAQQTIFDEYALPQRVGIVTGGNRGLGLEMSLALCELGARIYALDLPGTPSEDFERVRAHVRKLGGGRSLEYAQVDTTDQKAVWKIVEESKQAI